LGPEKEDSCVIIDVHSFNFVLGCLGEPWDLFVHPERANIVCLYLMTPKFTPPSRIWSIFATLKDLDIILIILLSKIMDSSIHYA
jgi:hypothetical protein